MEAAYSENLGTPSSEHQLWHPAEVEPRELLLACLTLARPLLPSLCTLWLSCFSEWQSIFLAILQLEIPYLIMAFSG